MSSSKFGKHRRWWIVLFLLALLGGWWGIDRLLHPQLVPVTRRMLPAGMGIIFSANGRGYPALENSDNAFGWDPRAVLDDRCRRVETIPSGNYFGLVSPTRKMVVVYRSIREGNREVTILRNNGQHVAETSIITERNSIRSVTDGGVLCIDGNRAFLPNGSMITLPRWCITHLLGSPEPSLLVVGQDSLSIDPVLYDVSGTAFRRMLRFPVHGAPGYMQGGMLFRKEMRFVVVPANMSPSVYQHEKLLARYGTAYLRWMWGEDGTVWGISDKGVSYLLRWRDATKPCLVKLPMQGKPDTRFVDLTRLRPNGYGIIYAEIVPGPAIWGDGRLIAVTETRRLLPDRVADLTDRVLVAMKKTDGVPREARVLTLYRDKKVVGTFTVSLKVHILRYYREHLAFTKDGKYLSWVIDTGRGPQVYAFETGL
jgi:hypothetical protein